MSEYNVDYSVIKKPGQDEDLTPEQASRWIELANDPIKFMTEECWVVGPFGKQLFEPRDYQMDLLDVVIENNLCVVNSPRQSGKCVGKNTKYTVRNKTTGEVHELTAEEFHTMVKDS